MSVGDADDDAALAWGGSRRSQRECLAPECPGLGARVSDFARSVKCPGLGARVSDFRAEFRAKVLYVVEPSMAVDLIRSAPLPAEH